MRQRLLPVFAAFDQLQLFLQNIFAGLLQAAAKAGNLTRTQGNAYLGHLGAGSELAQGMNEDGRAGQLGELFGWGYVFRSGAGGRTHARAQTGRGNNHNYLHGGLSVYGPGLGSSNLDSVLASTRGERSLEPRTRIYP